MKENRNVINTNIRLNLNREADRRAYERMRTRDRKEHKSYSSLVVTAVNEYFDRKDRLDADPYLETREKEDAFLDRVIETVRTSAQEAVSLNLFAGLLRTMQSGPTEKPREDSSEEALDYLDGF